MRILALAAALTVAAPALAQAAVKPMMHSHPTTHHTMMMHPSKSHNSGLGSIRHPTVGNTANQRTNGG